MRKGGREGEREGGREEVIMRLSMTPLNTVLMQYYSTLNTVPTRHQPVAQFILVTL